MKSNELKKGDKCIVIAGTHNGKLGLVQNLHHSKKGHITIIVLQSNRVRFKTLVEM